MDDEDRALFERNGLIRTYKDPWFWLIAAIITPCLLWTILSSYP